MYWSEGERCGTSKRWLESRQCKCSERGRGWRARGGVHRGGSCEGVGGMQHAPGAALIPSLNAKLMGERQRQPLGQVPPTILRPAALAIPTASVRARRQRGATTPRPAASVRRHSLCRLIYHALTAYVWRYDVHPCPPIVIPRAQSQPDAARRSTHRARRPPPHSPRRLLTAR